MLAIRVEMDLEIHQMDLEIYEMHVKAEFLNGELEEDIYIKQLEELVQEDKKHLVCKFKKSL